MKEIYPFSVACVFVADVLLYLMIKNYRGWPRKCWQLAPLVLAKMVWKTAQPMDPLKESLPKGAIGGR
jgi:hypothetical protein